DANGIMHVTAKDLGTGKEQKMTVTGGSSLAKHDIRRMVDEAEQHAEEDRRRKEAAETRNSAEQLVYQTERLLRDDQEAGRIPSDVTSEVRAALAELKEKLEGEDVSAIRSATEKAASAAQKIGTALYSKAREPDGPTASEERRGQDGDQGEDIVDAEIVDEDGR
ncbi:Hsp70 family protein, partial [Streptomyces sp. NPDC060048]